MEYCRQQIVQRENCLTLPFTLFLWIVFLLVIIVHSNVEQVFLTREGVVSDLQRIEVVRSPNETARPLTIAELETREDVNLWIQDGFLPRINGSVIKVYNRIAGSVVLSQSRAKRAQCDVDAGLRNFYDASCFPVDQPLTDSFAQLGPEFVHKYGLGEAEGQRYYAFLNFWDADNPSVMARPNTYSAEKIRLQQHAYLDTLLQREWIDSASIDLRMRFLAFNPETKVYLSTKIVFQFHRGGWVENQLEVHAETSDLYENGLAIVYDIIWVLLVACLMYVEVMQMKLVQATADLINGKAWNWRYWDYLTEYWSDFWNLVDWLSVGLGFAFVFEIMALDSNLKDLASSFPNIGPAAIQRAVGTGQYGSLGQGLGPYYDANLGLFKLLDDIESKRKAVQLLGFFYSMLIILRFFKGFRGQPRIAIMGLSLVNASYDMLHFLIVFFLVYVNYSLGGWIMRGSAGGKWLLIWGTHYTVQLQQLSICSLTITGPTFIWILFGPQLEEWNTLLKAMGVTLKIIYGDFDYDKIYRITPVIASLWFFSFIVILVFLVLNLLTALVYDKYMGVMHSTNYRGAFTLYQQVRDLFTDTLMNQSQSTDESSGKRRKINYEAIYEKMKEHVDRDEVLAEDAKLKRENDERERHGEEPLSPEVRNIRLRMARERSDNAETSWAVTNLEQRFQGEFANDAISRGFLIDRCGMDMPQAIYVMAKCIETSLNDAKTLEPEQFLMYTMRFEFADLGDQLDEIRRMLFSLQDRVVQKQHLLKETNSKVKENVRDLEPYLDEEWQFVNGSSGNTLYYNKQTEEVTNEKPLSFRLMDQPQKDVILERRRKIALEEMMRLRAERGETAPEEGGAAGGAVVGAIEDGSAQSPGAAPAGAGGGVVQGAAAPKTAAEVEAAAVAEIEATVDQGVKQAES
eukprot:g7474.t1